MIFHLFTLLFLALKLLAVIDWSWWLVLAPSIAALVFAFGLIVEEVMIDIKAVKEQARKEVARMAREELRAERFRAAVEEEKARLRTKRSFWDRLFPFHITITRKVMIDIKAVKEQARKEVVEERTKAAVTALKRKLNDLANAQQVVANLQREVADLEASIADGSFVK